jgi:hypothetical protein
MKPFFDNRNQHIGGQRNPDLRLHRVLTRAVKRLDTQVLLDPFEKQLHLPTAFVQRRNGCGGQRHIVGQKRYSLAALVFDPDAAQHLRVRRTGRLQRQSTDLVEHQVRSQFVHGARVAPFELGIALGARDKERACRMHGVQTREVQIPPVHQIKRPRFYGQCVHDIDFVHFAIGDVYEAGDIAPQVQQSVQFDSRFGFAKRRPRVQGQAQIYDRSVQCVDHRIQVHTECVVGVEWARHTDQGLAKIGVDLPRAGCVGVGKGVARNSGATKPHVVQACGPGAQVDLNVSQTLAVGQLGKRHCKKLVQAREVFDFVIARPALHAACERSLGQVRHELRKYEFALMHDLPGRRKTAKVTYGSSEMRVSNRHQKKTSIYTSNSFI